MTASFRIYRHDDNESVLLSRDVRDAHPQWVHDQLGTTDEAELQSVISELDPFSYAGDTVGDSDGVKLDDPQLAVVDDDNRLGIVRRVDGRRAMVDWTDGESSWADVDDLMVD
jgi:hypothetical protein